MNFYNDAADMAACGFHVFPLFQGEPARGLDTMMATDDLATLAAWHKVAPRAGVGVLCGEASDLLVLHVSRQGFDHLHRLSVAGGHSIPVGPHSAQRVIRSIEASGRGSEVLPREEMFWLRNIAGFKRPRIEIAPGLVVWGEGGTVPAPGPKTDWLWVTPPEQVRTPTPPEWLVGMILRAANN